MDADGSAAFAARLQAEWERKPGDVLDELAANLAAPSAARRRDVLAAAARRLRRSQTGKKYPRRSAAELLALHIYSCEGPHIDELMGFGDVPEKKDVPAWGAYRTAHADRNSDVWSLVNGAMRAAAGKGGKEAWVAVRKWIKFICVLTAAATDEHPGSEGKDFVRGIAAIPDAVVAKYGAMSGGDCIGVQHMWSCTPDPRLVAKVKPRLVFRTRVVTGAVALHGVTRYPEEHEVIIPPLSLLTVSKVRGTAPGRVTVDCKYAGTAAPKKFLASVRAAAKAASKGRKGARVKTRKVKRTSAAKK